MNQIIIICFVIYALIILSLSQIKTYNKKKFYLIRKSVHLTTGLILFFFTFYFDKQAILMAISLGTAFSIITYRITKFNFIHTTSRLSMGTIFYPLGLLLSFILLYDFPLYYFQISLMTLAISDTIANLGGEIKKNNMRFAIFKEEKSIMGVVGFAFSAFLIHLLLLPEINSEIYFYIILSVIASVNFEVISIKGSDNLTIPLGGSLFFLGTKGFCKNSEYIIIIILLLAAISIILYKKNFLTKYGSIAAYLLGIYLFAILGLAWSIPVVTFFLTSTLFTKLNGFINKKNDDTNRRNAWQVTANILAATAASVAYIFTNNVIFIYFFITFVATVTADTWASELGPVFTKKCLSLADGKIKDSGISGGISLPGTVASLAGSLIISVLSFYLFFHRIDISLIAIITFAGFTATFADSIFSAYLEPKLLKMNYFKKELGPDSISPNDLVNFTASLTGPIFFIIFQIL